MAEALVDGQTYADFEKLHAVFTELRTSAPVALAKPDGIEPFWFISKFDDLQFVEKDNSLFHAGDKSTIMITEEELKIIEKKIDAEISESVKNAIEAPEPPSEELTKYIWAED
ncbi:MAG: hypothetical protein VXW20_01825 [Pseudomonadota bacterium]|nr:hypothetical protein [Pseudomonadota bacterium]